MVRAWWSSVSGEAGLGVTLMKTAVQEAAAAWREAGESKLPGKRWMDGEREVRAAEAGEVGSRTRAWMVMGVLREVERSRRARMVELP